ncbi:proton-coupled amino acid transporter-like protein CG1139 [Drosophila innubila]|uniref:proton-coupled amino acid transporter-like protein CG1139 n=1 Tax=Drosophila innubila TaxID=198719 RepID=UPI00148C7423|nr:proton-coupled amino acid transporter-like protein CG1139 [Drosophila innubila]
MLPPKIPSRRHLSIQMNQELKAMLQPIHIRAFHFLQRSLGSGLSYNSHIERDVVHPITDMEAFINLLKCAFGTGCLAMPKAFYNAGWLLGLISTILLGSFVVYAMHVLLNDINTLCKRYKFSALSYSETMELATLHGPDWLQPFSKWLACQVDFFLCVYHFGVDCVYVVFIAKCMKELGDIYLRPIDIRLYMALLTLPLMLTFFIRDLKYLVPFSIISNIFMLISLSVILRYIFGNLPSLAERQAFQVWTHYPLFFGTVLFAVEAVGVILSLQLNMLNPDHYLGTFGILNRAMFIVIAFYAAFGFFGYWQYGDKTASSILNNLPINEVLPQCVLAMLALAIFFSYALQGYVTIEIIWRNYMLPRLMDNATRSLEYLVRMAMVIASVLCAIAYPDFGLLLSLVGSFCLAQVGLIYPGIVNLSVCYDQGYGPFKLLLWRSLLFIAVGLCGGIAGTVVSLTAIHEQLSNNNNNRLLF